MAPPLHNAAGPERSKLLATARKLGVEAGQACLDKAEHTAPDFGERAYDFIVDYVRAHGTPDGVAGEAVTLAAKVAGIRPHDDRAFGGVYARAIRAGDIRVVGATNRVRGHGTAGGRLYGPGEGARDE